MTLTEQVFAQAALLAGELDGGRRICCGCCAARPLPP